MFNDAHWHIAINHLPVIGYLAALLMALCGLFIRDRMLHIVAWMTTLLSSLWAVITGISGEPALEQISELDGISHAYLLAHERWGDWTYYAAMGVGVLALVGWILTLRKPTSGRGKIAVLVLLMLVANGLSTITATLGGAVRHTEALGDRFSKFISGFALNADEKEMLADEIENDFEAE